MMDADAAKEQGGGLNDCQKVLIHHAIRLFKSLSVATSHPTRCRPPEAVMDPVLRSPRGTAWRCTTTRSAAPASVARIASGSRPTISADPRVNDRPLEKAIIEKCEEDSRGNGTRGQLQPPEYPRSCIRTSTGSVPAGAARDRRRQPYEVAPGPWELWPSAWA